VRLKDKVFITIKFKRVIKENEDEKLELHVIERLPYPMFKLGRGCCCGKKDVSTL